MNLPSIAFLALFVIFIVIFAYIFLSKRGQKEYVDLLMNTSNVVLIGELPEIRFTAKFSLLTIKQKLRLYKCKSDDSSFYVLELTQYTVGGVNRQFVKISPEIASELKTLLSG